MRQNKYNVIERNEKKKKKKMKKKHREFVPTIKLLCERLMAIDEDK